MKFTFGWLKQFVDVNVTPGELADRLTMAGLEVAAVEELFPDLVGVKVVEILSVNPHPDADRLVVCQVAYGDETVQVVCGAPNARAGLFSALALPGTKLPSGIMIKKSKIRGQVSQGMLCSEKDLGISENHAGIMELNWLNKSGDDLSEALQLKDTVIEVDLTPNRPDCASVIGVARESAAFYNTSLKLPVAAGDIPRLTGDRCEFTVAVEHEDCPRYTARLLKNIKIGPSPWWLKKRLLAVGQRPINNVVDVTNFVMLEYGQPLHAFDYRKLRGGGIVVRRPRPGESMTTLDGVARSLEPDMLMICDAEGPVAVAGVMGGANSEVDAHTTEVLLESACFSPVSVRRTAKRLNLATEASYRFERGVDPQLPPVAMERAVRLLREVAGAEVAENGIDLASGVKKNEPIRLRVNRVNDLLGYSFGFAEISAMLSSIEIDVRPVADDILLVTPPSFRIDLEREVDLIEEVARLKGYNEFPHSMPLVPMSPAWQDPVRKLRQQTAAAMIAQGFHEAINYSFVTPRHLDMLGVAESDIRRKMVRLLNPLAEDQSVLRTMLLPGLLENVRRNVSYQVADIRLFEIGKCFFPVNELEQPEERLYLTAVMSGRRLTNGPLIYAREEKCDIYDVKGVVENLLVGLGFAGICFDFGGQGEEPYCDAEEFVRVSVQGSAFFGALGRIERGVLNQFGIKQDVHFLSLPLDVLLGAKKNKKQFSPLPRFPAVKWDIAVVVPESVRVGEIIESILHSGIAIIEHVELFDVFRGGSIGNGMKSVAIKVTYRSAEQTLDDETVNREHQKIIDMILVRFNGQLREV